MEKAMNVAFFYLKFRPRSVWELRQYMEKKSEKHGFTSAIIDAVVARLIELRYLDDREFVRWFIDQRQRVKPRSRLHLVAELKKHGITAPVLEEYFLEHAVNESASAYDLLLRKAASFARFSARERNRRIMNYLSRRGFSYEVIKKTIARWESGE
ncbi:MAG: RecX family transcriptional regulator [Patescibacteria group bacterium]|nr:RecX family transcriptional regulator [Patescibacteria group bacterium]